MDKSHQVASSKEETSLKQKAPQSMAHWVTNPLMFNLIHKLFTILLPVTEQENQPMTLNQTISVVREVARQNLRLHKVNAIRAELLEANNLLDRNKENTKQMVENAKLRIDSLKFDLDNLNPADPRSPKQKEKLTKELEAEEKALAKFIENSAKNLEELTKEVADITAKITAVEDGTVKLCKESLQEEACRLVTVLGDKNLMEAIKKAESTEAEF